MVKLSIKVVDKCKIKKNEHIYI